MDRLALNIRLLREDIYGSNPFVTGNNLIATSRTIIPPKGDILIPLGVTFTIPKGYILDIRLAEELIDKSVGLIGYTFAPQSMHNEFGVMIFNYNKQSVRIEEADDVATFNLIKVEDLQISVVD